MRIYNLAIPANQNRLPTSIADSDPPRYARLRLPDATNRSRCIVFRSDLSSCKAQGRSLVAMGTKDRCGHIILPNVEVWHWLPGAPLRNSVEGCNQEGHCDSERVASCPPPSCSASLLRPREGIRANLIKDVVKRLDLIHCGSHLSS